MSPRVNRYGAAVVALALAVYDLALLVTPGGRLPIGRKLFETLVFVDPSPFYNGLWADLLDLVALAGLLGWLAARIFPRGETSGVAPRWLNWAVVAGLVLSLALGVQYGADVVAATVVSFAVLAWVGPRLMGTRDATLKGALLLALGLRLVVGLVVAGRPFGDGAGRVLDDEIAYDYAARAVAQSLWTGVYQLNDEWNHLVGHYLDVMGLTYALAGPGIHMVLMRVINALLGTIALAMAVGIARTIGGKRQGWIVAVIGALWPTLVLWSGSGLRESLTWADGLVIPWLLTRASVWRARRLGLLALAAGALSFPPLTTLRPHIAAAALVALAATAVLAPLPLPVHQPRRVWLAALSGATAVGVLVGLGLGLNRLPPLQELTPRALEYRAAALELTPLMYSDAPTLPHKPDPAMLNLGTIVRVRVPGHSGFQTGIAAWYEDDPPRYVVYLHEGESVTLDPNAVVPLSDESVGWDTLLGRLGIGLSLFFVPVIPEAGEALKRLASIPDTVVWDGLVLVAAISLVRAGAWRNPSRMLLAFYALGTVLGLALLSANLGTVVRHRDLMVLWLAIVTAPWLEGLAVRAARRARTGRAPHAVAPPPAPAPVVPATRA